MTRRVSRTESALVESLLSEAREELGRADNKASILLAASGVVVGALIAAVLAGSWSPSDLSTLTAWIWWLACGFLAAGIACFGSAIYPRTTRPAKLPDFVAYFGDVVVFEHRADLEQALSRTTDTPGSRNLDQLELISKIVSKKYLFLRRALLSFTFGALLLGAVAVLTTVGL
ncbi:Pycsar system effector family protein [Frondihabitans sp. 4ASC-45]|uniref:Pycsar system effector family protein n=1 Tax=Frondihabitans sp. 4ASC-45 TaxID=3111636 RepID=UPI003C2D1570